MKNCLACQKEIEPHLNYCDFECMKTLARENGAKVYAPNDLPIVCIDAEGDLLEHEHAKHPDYKFPVKVEWCGLENEPVEMHAVIYFDDAIVLTIHECCYATWKISDGSYVSGSLWNKNYKLCPLSVFAIKHFSSGKNK